MQALLAVAVARDEAGIPLLNKPRRPGGNGGCGPGIGGFGDGGNGGFGSSIRRLAQTLVATTVASVFLNFFAAYSDRNCVEVATNSKLAIGTGDQDDAIALAFAGNMSATNLDVSKIAVARHRCQTHVRSHIQFRLPV
jgi:hypothetical protein